MTKYAKWIGGGLGWVLGGPIGAVLGFIFGSMFGSMQSGEFEYHPTEQKPVTQAGDFSVSLLILSAAIMKADGRVVKSELDYVKRFLLQHFSEDNVRQKLLLLKELLNQSLDLTGICGQIRHYMSYAEKLQLLHYLFGIALADGSDHPNEIAEVHQISSLIGVTDADLKSIQSMFIKDTGYAYRILDVSPDATNDEIKKAYRKMALKYHPDKVAHLGEEIQKSAKEKFQELNAAYETIKKQRGMN